jgi:NDP-sugar pyrophosphorylase family protein
MVLAAGLGTRLQPYTLKTPKPLIPLLGVPCIEFSLLQLRAIGVQKIVVNVHAHSSQMKEYLKGVSISDETQCLLGSAGGFRKALPLIELNAGQSESFFALNSDVVCNVDLIRLQSRHEELRKKHGVVMTLCIASGEMLKVQQGSYTEILFDVSSGLVTGLGEKKSKVPFYVGTAIFETEAFRHLTEGVPAEFVPEVLKPWIEKGKVGFQLIDDLWLDVGSPELWWNAHLQLLNGMNRGKIPEVWKSVVLEGMKKVNLSEKEGVVDYDQPVGSVQPHTKGYIRYQGDRTDV